MTRQELTTAHTTKTKNLIRKALILVVGIAAILPASAQAAGDEQVAQLVKIGILPVQFEVGGRYYAEPARIGPEWGLRLGVVSCSRNDLAQGTTP